MVLGTYTSYPRGQDAPKACVALCVQSDESTLIQVILKTSRHYGELSLRVWGKGLGLNRCEQMDETPYTKSRSPLMRTLYNTYVIPSKEF